MSKEELKAELIEEIEEAYRLPNSVQILLFLIIAIMGVGLLVTVEASLEVKILAFMFGITYLYPVIVKIHSKLFEAIGIALFAGTMSGMIYYLLTNFSVLSLGNLALLVIIIEVIGIELLHHVSETIKMGRNKIILTLDIVLTVIFGAALYLFLSEFFSSLGVVVNGGITALLAALFLFAIMPEKPF